MRLLGIDYGIKKIGLSFGDSDAKVAVPLEVISNRGEETLKELADRVRADDIGLVVVGVPLYRGGHHGPEQLDATREFIKKLRAVLPVDVVEEDESFTTSESIRLQKEEGSTVPEDALAAMLILQSFFDRTKEVL